MTTVAQSNPMKLKPILKLKFGGPASVPIPEPVPVAATVNVAEVAPPHAQRELTEAEIAGRARRAERQATIAAMRQAGAEIVEGIFRAYGGGTFQSG